MDGDPDGEHEELLLASCLVRAASLAEDRTTVISMGATEFRDTELGKLFDALRDLRSRAPHLAGVGIRYNVDSALHPHLDRALAAWDREAAQLHPQLPVCADEVEMLATSVNRRWRHRQVRSLAEAMQHHYRSGDTLRAGEIAVEIRDLVRTSDDQFDSGDPYTDHSPQVVRAELQAVEIGRGYPIHPKLDTLLYKGPQWCGELILLGAKTKVGKTAFACWWATRLLRSAEDVAPEAQLLMFCTEMTRAELAERLQGYLDSPEEVFVATPLGRPRFLLFGKEFFARVGSDPSVRLRAVKAELRRFAAANLHWSRQHGIAIADCWFAGCIVDYVTSMLASGNDFSMCEAFVRDIDTSFRVCDPGWLGLDSRRFGDLTGLPCLVMVCEQVNARREPAPRITTDHRTGVVTLPPLDPPSPTEINGARAVFEAASVYLMLARDHEGRVHSPETALLRVSGRSVATRELQLRFVHGRFDLPGDFAASTNDRGGHGEQASTDVETVDPAEEHRRRIWSLPCYVLAPPAVTGPDGAPVPSQDRWVRIDPAVEGWHPDNLTDTV